MPGSSERLGDEHDQHELEAQAEFEADYEAELEKLGGVEDARDLYLEEASIYRPISTGDVFSDVPIPGCTDEENQWRLSMVLSHPSAMRKGPDLEARARAGPVMPVKNISSTKYEKGHFDIFALPLFGDIARTNGHDVEDRPWAARLDVTGTIQTDDLDVRRRVACLSPGGVVLLLQKVVNADTRAAVRLDTIEGIIESKLEEIEQIQTWNEALAAPRVDASGDLEAELRTVAYAFDNAMKPLEDLLRDPLRRGEVWRQLSAALREQLALG